MQPALDEAIGAVERDGYVVLHDVAPIGVFDAAEAAVDRLAADAPTGRNDFEGHHTVRLYNLLAKDPVFASIADNDDVVAVCQGVLGPHIQVSIILAIRILPGETAQGLHRDDGLFPLPDPHPPVVFNTMWAVDDFTAANGGTRLIPGSHRWPPGRRPGPGDRAVVAEMPRGSVLAWVGNLWHEGGANTSDRPRLGIAMNYNQAWLRQQENQYLGIPADLVAGFSERLQRLVGWDIHPPFIGNVDGRNPLRRLRGAPSRT